MSINTTGARLVTIELTEDDRAHVMLALGFMAGACNERKDEHADSILERNAAIAGKISAQWEGAAE